jgi:hypothetical protein
VIGVEVISNSHSKNFPVRELEGGNEPADKRPPSSEHVGLNKEHEKKPQWPVQFLISTHSSHIANEARFEAIRYFLPSPANDRATIWKTKIKDLRQGMSD